MSRFRGFSVYLEAERGFRGWLVWFFWTSLLGAAFSVFAVVIAFEQVAALYGVRSVVPSPVLVAVIVRLLILLGVVCWYVYGLYLFLREDIRTPAVWTTFFVVVIPVTFASLYCYAVADAFVNRAPLADAIRAQVTTPFFGRLFINAAWAGYWARSRRVYHTYGSVGTAWLRFPPATARSMRDGGASAVVVSAGTHGDRTMRYLLPLSDYEATARSLGARTAVVTALIWGILMTPWLISARGSLAVGTALTIGVAGSLMFGCIATLGMRSAGTKMMRRVYAIDPKLFPELPDGFDARLPASLMRGSIAVGGVLLLDHVSARFVPHRRNLKQHRAPTQIQLDSPAEIEVIERRTGLLGRLFQPGAVRLLKLGNGNDAMVLLVPTPDSVAASVREYVNSARDAAKQQSDG